MTDSARTALVTGAGSGIGRATTLALAGPSMRLAVIDQNRDRAIAVADEAIHRGAERAIGLEADVSNEADIERAVDRTVHELGTPTAVFANAGIEVNRPAHDMPQPEWQRVIDVNLTGVFLTAKHTLKAMLRAAAGGSIVCTGSPAAFVGFAGTGNGAYGASKGGIVALVKSLAVDYAPHDIRVNAVIPGAIETPHIAIGIATHRRPRHLDDLRTRAKAQVPLGRLGHPDEVAAAVTWLLSPAASYVTGTSLICDGGLLARSANDF
jgi:NAD(P)-dependent dehydrogenase (short-subunit alcohol dehydrogenase family)